MAALFLLHRKLFGRVTFADAQGSMFLRADTPWQVRRGFAWFAALGLVALVLAGCGFEKTKKAGRQTVGPVVSDGGAGLALTGDLSERTFAGSLLVWKPGTTRDDVSAILQATRRYNEAYTRSRAVIEALYESDLRRMDERRAALLAEKSAPPGQASGAEALEARKARLDFGAGWFSALSARLTSENPGSFDETRAQALFARYCDAKLWELASHPMIADGTFSQRPSASVLCEAYFESQNYFESPACAQDNSKAQNYFRCMWTALRKTSFVQSGPLQDARHGPVLEALAASPEFRKLVSGRDASAGFCGLDQLALRKFRLFKVVQTEPCVIPGSTVVLDLNVVSESRPTTSLDKMNAGTVAASMDDQEARVSQDRLLALYPQALLLSPSPGPRAGRELTALEKESDDFARRLAAMDKRGVNCGAEPSGFSATDVLVSLPFAVDGPMASGQSGNVGAVLRSSEGCRGMPAAALFPELLADKGADEDRRRELDASLAALAVDRDAVVTRYCDMNNGRPESASRKAEVEARPWQTAIVDERSILATRDLRLVLKPVQTSALASAPGSETPRSGEDAKGLNRALLSFGPASVPVSGCFRSFVGPEAGAAAACPTQAPGEAQHVAADVVYFPEKGSLQLSFPLTRDTLVATKLEARLGDFEGATFVVELFGNAFEGKVPYISGAVRFERGNEVVGRGVASYMIEANAAFEEANALVRECPRLGF